MFNPVAPFPLGHIECPVRGLDQSSWGACLRKLIDGDSNTDGSEMTDRSFILEAERSDGLLHPVGHRFRPVEICGRQNHRKLFTAITCEKVTGTRQRGLQCGGDLDKALVPISVTISVVQILEVIDINEQQR